MSFWNLFQKKPKTFLGIDIGASAIKTVELEKKEERFHLRTYGIFPVVAGLKDLDQSKPFRIPFEDLAQALKRTLSEAGIISREACFSIPIYHSFATLIDLPLMSKEELARAIPFEARKYIPAPVSEVALNWNIVNFPEQEKQSEIHVFLVAVPKEVISKYQRLIQLSGLRIRALEAETFSLARSLVGNDKSAIVIIDSGARSTNISIIDQGFIRGASNLDIGGLRLTQEIAEKLRVDFLTAEAKKNASQLSPEVLEAVKPVVDSIVNEVKNIINRYQTKHNRRLEKYILAGNGLRIAGLAEYVSKKNNLEISWGSPFSRIVYPQGLEPAIKEIGSSLAVAVGLAMREN